MKILMLLTIAAIAIPAFFFSLLGCMKTPEHKADYGQENLISEVNDALNALGQPDPIAIKKGEFSYSVYAQSVDTGLPQVIMQTAKTVTDRSEDADNIYLTVVDETNELKDGVFKPSHEESHLVASKKPSSTAILALPTDTLIKVMAGWVTSFEAGKPRVSYHRLTQEKTEFPVPDLVQARADCGGLKTDAGLCSKYIPAVKVSFDKITWQSETRGVKTHFQIIASPSVPFFSSDLQFCRQDWIDYQGRVVPVNLCKEIKDFKFGIE